MGVNADLLGAWETAGQNAKGCLRAPCGQQQADQAAGDGDQEALGEELAYQSSATGAEGAADGELARPAG